jgi:hypothetical protein
MNNCAHIWEYWDVENNVKWDGVSTALNTRIVRARCTECRGFMSDLLFEAQREIDRLHGEQNEA